MIRDDDKIWQYMREHSVDFVTAVNALSAGMRDQKVDRIARAMAIDTDGIDWAKRCDSYLPRQDGGAPVGRDWWRERARRAIVAIETD